MDPSPTTRIRLKRIGSSGGGDWWDAVWHYLRLTAYQWWMRWADWEFCGPLTGVVMKMEESNPMGQTNYEVKIQLSGKTITDRIGAGDNSIPRL